jgi:hypothetical protein
MRVLRLLLQLCCRCSGVLNDFGKEEMMTTVFKWVFKSTFPLTFHNWNFVFINMEHLKIWGHRYFQEFGSWLFLCYWASCIFNIIIFQTIRLHLRWNPFKCSPLLPHDLSLFLSLLLPPLWSIGHPWNALFHFSFLILRQSVGLLGRGISPSQGRYLHKHRINADKHPCLEWVSNPWFQRSSERKQFMP